MGNPLTVDGQVPIHVFASSKSWIEGNALQQLNHVATLPGVTAVAGMPDLHPGKYGPVGSAILAEGVYPQLAGSDIGCGMSLFKLDVAARALKLEKLADRLRSLQEPWEGNAAQALGAAELVPSDYDGSLGSIGGGNHFCEVQAVEEIFAPETAHAAGLTRDLAFVLVHSGSRGLGHAILQHHLPLGMVALGAGEAQTAYLAQHDHAVRWARLNRQIIATRAAEAARASASCLTDVPHNVIEPVRGGYLHRKGAASATCGLVPVPGSRGTLSYLVEPLAKPEALASLAHGAGRKYERGAMHGRAGTTKSELARLVRNPFGGYVVCEDRDLLVEEAPDAYKSITRVIEDLTEFGLARIVASFRPLVTFKSAKRPEHEARRRERDERGGARGRRAKEVWR